MESARDRNNFFSFLFYCFLFLPNLLTLNLSFVKREFIQLFWFLLGGVSVIREFGVFFCYVIDLQNKTLCKLEKHCCCKRSKREGNIRSHRRCNRSFYADSDSLDRFRWFCCCLCIQDSRNCWLYHRSPVRIYIDSNYS